MKSYQAKSYQLYLIFVFFFLFLLFLEESFLARFSVFISSFYFYLIVIFFLLFFSNENFGFNIALLAGLILDLFSFFPLGVFTLSIGGSAYLVRKISRIFERSNVFAFLILLTFFLVFYKIFFIFGDFLFNFLKTL